MLRKSFWKKNLTDVRNRKNIEFLKLKLANIIVADYAVKIEELDRFCHHCNDVDAEGSKCVKFEGSMRPEIKKFIGY